MRTAIALAALLCTTSGLAAVSIDGQVDTSYGVAGRRLAGFLESNTPTAQAIVISPSGRQWVFADDPEDPRALYIMRSLRDGSPDSEFGPQNDGQRRILLPAGLIAQSEHLQLHGAIIQPDGKPLIFGALRAGSGEVGPYPALICRLTVAGTLDASFDGEGCALLRSFSAANEWCEATGLAYAALDQSLVVAGNCASGSNPDVAYLARLQSNGALDLDFGAGAGLILPAMPANIGRQRFEGIALRADGKIAVATSATRLIQGALVLPAPGVRLFDGGGSADLAFGQQGLALIDPDTAGISFDVARDVVVRADLGIVLLGEGRVSDARPAAILARLTSQGSLDPAFGTDGVRVEDFGQLAPGSRVGSLALDPSGRLLISAEHYSGAARAGRDVGTDFRFALPPTENGDLARVIISSDRAASGTLSSPVLAQSIPFVVNPGVPAVIEVPNSLHDLALLPNGVITNRSLRVQASSPVSVVPLHGRSFNLDSALVRPLSALGKNYLVIAPATGVGRAQVVVVATQGATVVRVLPATNMAGRPAGVAFDVLLQQGEAMHLRADQVDSNVSGTQVMADKPIAVFAGHMCAQMGADFCDLAYEQMTPMDQLGTFFVTAPHPLRSSDLVQLVAREPGTDIYVNRNHRGTLGQGESMQIALSARTVIQASKPIALAQLQRGCTFEGNPNCVGDPHQQNVEPIERWAHRYVVSYHHNSGQDTQVPPMLRLIAPQNLVDSVRINGQPLSPGSFSPSGEGFAHAHIARTAHTSDVVTADGPIFASVIGMRGSESHAHVAAVLSTGTGNAEDANADDRIVRLQRNGQRDLRFGANGIVSLDHSAAFVASAPSLDRPVGFAFDGDRLVVASSVLNPTAGQRLLLSYRLVQDDLLVDGFE